MNNEDKVKIINDDFICDKHNLDKLRELHMQRLERKRKMKNSDDSVAINAHAGGDVLGAGSINVAHRTKSEEEINECLDAMKFASKIGENTQFYRMRFKSLNHEEREKRKSRWFKLARVLSWLKSIFNDDGVK
ncbi:hypothetical protein [uncultured Paraglaciecola sp.]|uniref:hypothetical protein n=1 Tax=uncultured Paraglaciecola sp. TaxID=1765024 RepID=UPI002638A23D|nr:hypothetical protein [uncultured Paraglaciecola sp.]